MAIIAIVTSLLHPSEDGDSLFNQFTNLFIYTGMEKCGTTGTTKKYYWATKVGNLYFFWFEDHGVIQ